MPELNDQERVAELTARLGLTAEPLEPAAPGSDPANAGPQPADDDCPEPSEQQPARATADARPALADTPPALADTPPAPADKWPAPADKWPDLALEALRHGSFVHEHSLRPGREPVRSHERLEFLGDAVLGLVIAQRCYERFPDATEGDLTRLRASLVREESLALVARRLGLGELLLLGRGEQRTGGRDNPARLADALEAIIAAVFLSRGLSAARELVERLLTPLFEQSGALGRDPKTELQQLFQSKRRTPQYQVLQALGPDHAREYEVEVRLDQVALARGSGRSKKEAEQAAARAALEAPEALQRALSAAERPAQAPVPAEPPRAPPDEDPSP